MTKSKIEKKNQKKERIKNQTLLFSPLQQEVNSFISLPDNRVKAINQPSSSTPNRPRPQQENQDKAKNFENHQIKARKSNNSVKKRQLIHPAIAINNEQGNNRKNGKENLIQLFLTSNMGLLALLI